MPTFSILFIYFILHRFLSGVRNGMMYNNKVESEHPIIIALGMSAITLFIMRILLDQQGWYFIPDQLMKYGILLASCGCIASVFLALNYKFRFLHYKYTTDIHLWTLLEQSLLGSAFIIAGLDSLVCAVLAVYPSVIAQKTMINLLNNQDWNYEGTDDPEGKYYGLPSLGLKIPRITHNIRLTLAIISIIASVIYSTV
jgi:hypothetical protein